MRSHALLLGSLLLSLNVYANGSDRPEPNGQPIALTAEQFTELVQEIRQDQAQDQSQDQSNNNQSQSSPKQYTRIEYPVNAPSIALGAGRNTAPRLVCLSLGGSASNGSNGGSAGGIWCRIEKVSFYEDEGDEYWSMGEYEQAASSYCQTDRQIQVFGDLGFLGLKRREVRDTCLAWWTQKGIETFDLPEVEAEESAEPEGSASLGKLLESPALTNEYETVAAGDYQQADAVHLELEEKLGELRQEVEDLSLRQDTAVKPLLDDRYLREFRKGLQEIPKLKPMDDHE